MPKKAPQPKELPEGHLDLTPEFQGFRPPTSNTTYTPNQFFDVCLPHASRGCVRLVGFMIRKTLGWCDADGNPLEDQVFVTYNQLVKHAGISRKWIRQTIDEAVERRFIRCVRQPRPSTAGNSAVTGLYELRWHESADYIKDPKAFRGFFEGEGNRTDIPNQFFDEIMPREALSVVKVVGSIVRFSIGFQARRGRRRQQVALSFSTIQRYVRIGDRTTLSQAVQHAVDSNFILRVKEGFFSPDKGHQESTTYALKWLDSDFYLPTGSKTLPEEKQPNLAGNRSQNQTRTGSKTRPGNRSQNQTTLKRNTRNETTEMKQQQAPSGLAVAAHDEIIQLLNQQGISKNAARKLATVYDEQRIRNQITWLGDRGASKNPAGLLVRAIQEGWEEPIGEKVATSQLSDSPGARFAAGFYAGFAGHADQPTAEPSAKEIETAERYVARLRKIWPTKDLKMVEQWGRKFGDRVREQQRFNEKLIPSFTPLLRLHGDEFYKGHKSRHEEAMRRARQAAEAAHQENHTARWTAYVRTTERAIKKQNPNAYAEFEADRTERRAEIESGRWVTDREGQLERFDTDEKRIEHLLEFFATDEDHPILEFWEWDEQHNPNRFEPEGVSL